MSRVRLLCCPESNRKGAPYESENRVQDKHPAPGEISEALLEQEVPNVWISVPAFPDDDFQATVSDLRESLKPLGLDVTPVGTVNWTENYPGAELARRRICELEQERADLLHQLRELSPDTFVLRVVK